MDNLLNLRKLELSHNSIEKIEGLNNTIKLQELFLDKNQIHELEGLGNLENLIILFLESNQISEFNNNKIETLKNLNFLGHGEQNQVLKYVKSLVEKKKEIKADYMKYFGSIDEDDIALMEKAIEEEYKASNEDEKKRIDVFRQFVRMAYGEPSVMIALMKKFVPDIKTDNFDTLQGHFIDFNTDLIFLHTFLLKCKHPNHFSVKIEFLF